MLQSQRYLRIWNKHVRFFVFPPFQMSDVKSDLLILNPKVFLRFEHFFYFFRIFLMIFPETTLPKSPNLTCHRFWIFQVG